MSKNLINEDQESLVEFIDRMDLQMSLKRSGQKREIVIEENDEIPRKVKSSRRSSRLQKA